MNTGDRIRIARKQAGLTQKELAEKIGVKHSAVHKYESGIVVNLKRETIDALATALDVKPSWLMCMDDEQQESSIRERFLKAFDQLSPVQQEILAAQAEAALAVQKSLDIHQEHE